MQVTYEYGDTLAISQRVNWRVEDIIGGERTLDFGRPFLPDALVDAESLGFLSREDKLVLNQIRGNSYLALFGLVEEFILPFVLEHARGRLSADDLEVRALLQFAGEEAKHIHLFRSFMEEFREGFGHACEVIGPASELADAVLAHDQLAVALTVLHIEWMTQRHYVESAKGDRTIDTQFKSLLRHHWMEEAQHAKIDTLIVAELAARRTPREIQAGIEQYQSIGRILAEALKKQVELDLDSFQRATSRGLSPAEKRQFVETQARSYDRTFLEAGSSHPNFVRTLSALERM